MNIINTRTGERIVSNLSIRSNHVERFIGFMGRRKPADGCGMLFLGTGRVHTCFMRFALDLYYLSSSLVVVGWHFGVPPFRFPDPPEHSRNILELPSAESSARPDVLLNDQLAIVLGKKQ